MLRVDVKKTDALNLEKPLVTYCQTFYGAPALESVRQLIQQLHECRAELKLINSASGHELAQETYEKYLAAISVMEKRFPWGEGKTAARVTSVWCDSSRAGAKTSMSSLPFERLCVVFNLAAVSSCTAADVDRSSAEGQKIAIQKFQTAAGLFNLCRDQLISQVVGPPLTADLTESGLSMFSSLMLAQAQSCFYETAVKDRLGRGLLSKLAHQVADFYGSSATHAKKLTGSLDASWLQTFECQQKAFLAAANFQDACAMKEKATKDMAGFGLCVTRFREAKMLAKNASQHKLTDVSPLLQSIDSEMRGVESDNNSVYMEVVPDRSKLPPLAKIATVKASVESIDKLDTRTNFQGFRAVLEQMLPQEVRSYAQDYKTRGEGLVQAIEDEGRQIKTVCETTLADLNLPYCLEPSLGVSDDLWNTVQQVQLKGGVAALMHTLGALGEMDTMVVQLAAEIESELNREEQEDDAMRARFAEKWTRSSSSQLNGTFREQIRTYLTKIDQARNANQTIAQRGADLRALAPNLGKTRAELDESLPEGIVVQGGSAEYVLRQLAQFDATRTEVQQFADALKQEILQDPIDADLVLAFSKRLQLSDVVMKKIDEFGKSRLELTLKRQTITESLQLVREAFDKMDSSQVNNARVVYLKEIHRTADGVMQCLNDASEGINFFSRLADYLRTIQQQANDFCFARNEEKNGLLNSLTRKFAMPPEASRFFANMMPTGTIVTPIAPNAYGQPIVGTVIQTPYTGPPSNPDSARR